jgi:predicted transcriptional regulator
MASETVRIKPETHVKLKQLAEATGQSMPDVLDDAVEALRRQRLLEDTNQAYAALRSNSKAWQRELAERAIWNVSLADGLEDD